MPIFYVYALIDPRTNTPFYVGKGKGRRYKSHLTETGNGVNPLKQNIINKIRSLGMEVGVEFLQTNLSEDEAFVWEISYIQHHGRRENGGILANMNDGGTGQTGHVPSAETRKKISKQMTGENNGFFGKNHSDSAKTAIGEAQKGKTLSIEQKDAISKQFKGKPKSAEHRAKISAALKGKEKTAEHIEKMAQHHRGKTISDEQKSMISKQFKGKPKSAEHRAKISAALKGRKKS